MKYTSYKIFLFVLLIALASAKQKSSDDAILTYTLDPKKQNLQLYWKNDKGGHLKSIQNLKTFVEHKGQKLLFAMNAGMYKKDLSPQGLFIQQQKIIAPLDTASAGGNFYLKPNGVFYLTTDNIPVICTTEKFLYSAKINYATQSGPMLLIDGNIHPAFKEGSTNLNIRNGVGILSDNRIVFAISMKEVNFYDFALYFKKLGCKNALYLDGFVSRAYLPEQKWVQLDGNFGVMVGVSK